MPLIADSPGLWQRLLDICQISGGDPADQAELRNSIQPVLDATSPMLAAVEQLGWTTAVTGTGVKTVTTVPEGQRWLLLAYWLTHSGVFTFGDWRVRQDGSGLAVEVLGAADENAWVAPGPLIAKPGAYVQVHVDAFTSGGNITSVLQVVVIPTTEPLTIQ